jgi:ribosome production factor 1
MGKKLRGKTKKDKPKPRNKDGTIIKKKKVIKPETHFNQILKTGTENDLENEMEKLNELNRINPTKNTKNKQKRRELVLQRRHMKKRLLSKLRRLHQKRKEEINNDENENDSNQEDNEENKDNKEKEYKPKQTTKTIEMMREKDETMIDENDTEIKEALENDEYKNYFNNEYTPQILITTSISHTGGIFRFIKELKNFLPNSYFYYRKKFDLGTIMKSAIEKEFTDIIVITERLRKPYKLLLIHLPNGPSMEFKLFDVIYQDEIEGHGVAVGYNPELMFRNFKTTLGVRVQRALNALFPKDEELKGRELISFQNHRDFIFFRYYRYIFTDNFTNVNLQEIGPRFSMRLLYVQKGLFDPEKGDYEWLYKDKMGVKRRKFYL